MLKFSCQCGKEYKYPDRVAGREVRCAQCQKVFIVPDSSQDEPVIPREDPQPVPPEPVLEVPVVKQEPIPEPETTKSEPVVEAESPKPESESAWGDVPLPEGNGKLDEDASEEESDEEEAEASEKPRRAAPFIVIPVVVVLLIGAFCLGYSLRGPSSGDSPVPKPAEAIVETETSDASKTIQTQAETLKKESETARTELSASLKFPAAEAAEIVKEADKDKRTAAMKTLSERREKILVDWNAMLRSELTAGFLSSLPELAAVSLPILETSVGDWKVDEQTPLSFTVRSADGGPALVSLDGNPAEKKKDGNTLDDIAAAFSDDDGKSDTQMHTVSLRIDSGSSQAIRLIWPSQEEAALEGDKIKEFRFSLYLSEKGNAVFKPGKPEGIDKTLECSSIALRLYSDAGFVEYVPASNEMLIALVQQARRGWMPQRIPIRGDDAWKRNDYGLIGPLIVRRIELIVRPTGEGVTFWVDNLGINR